MESFFYEACKIDTVKTTELITRRYNGVDHILQMPVSDFIEFIKLAKEKEREERIFAMWVSQLPYMSEEKYIAYEDYKDKITGKNIDTRSTSELLEDIEEIERQFNE